jgi:hypothetical protein
MHWLSRWKTIFAGTYFPKENWLEMLHYFVDMQNKTPQALIDQAQKVTEGVKMLKMFLCGRNIDCLDY